jgi:signal peptidase I
MDYKKKIVECLKKKKLFCAIKYILIYSWKGSDVYSYILFFLLVYLTYNFVLTPLVFPIIFGTKIPFNTIVSESMEHDSNFEIWWQKYGVIYEKYFNITKEEFEKFSFKNGLYRGDFVLVLGVKKDNIKVGDIVAYYAPSLKRYIVHRVVKIKNNGCFETMGDNNAKYAYLGVDPQLPFEKNVCNIEGKVVLRIPYLGLPRYWLFKTLN